MSVTLIALAVAVAATLPQGPAPADKPLDISGPIGGVAKASQAVARDQASFDRIWSTRTHGVVNPPPAPHVDFKKYDVVVVYAGTRPTGGYQVTIDGVTVKGKKAVVHATIRKPAPGMMVTQMITSPFAMRAVEKLPAGVTFDVAEKSR